MRSMYTSNGTKSGCVFVYNGAFLFLLFVARTATSAIMLATSRATASAIAATIVSTVSSAISFFWINFHFFLLFCLLADLYIFKEPIIYIWTEIPLRPERIGMTTIKLSFRNNLNKNTLFVNLRFSKPIFFFRYFDSFR